MEMITGLAALPIALASALVLLGTLRRRPLGLALPVAGAAVVCFEALLVQGLSPLHAVARPGILAAHGALGVIAAAVALRRGRVPRLLSIRAIARPPVVFVAVLGCIVAASANEYLPNNWDSMTYHLARVAHWIQHGSVAAYPTSNARQLVYPPGAEYLLLVVQVLAGSDRLANLVQLAAWVILACSAPAFARAFGAPRRVAPWAAVMVASIPMGLLQASSTQNDLVAAVMAMGLLSTSLRFLHARPRWRWPDIALVGMAIGGALLVKPTALVAVAPFCAIALVAALRALRGWRWLELGRGIAAAAIVVGVTFVPARMLRGSGVSSDSSIYAPFVYLGTGEIADRLENVARGLVRHVPVPDTVEAAFVPPGGSFACGTPGSLCAETRWKVHEDFVGNPWHVALVAILMIVGAARWRRLPRVARMACVSLCASWVFFHFVFRDNMWVSRLQLPLFAIAAIALGALAGSSTTAWKRWSTAAAMAVLAVYGAYVALHNETRRPTLDAGGIAAAASPASYYASIHGPIAFAQETALAALAATSCDRLGLLIGGDSYDYPLTWRAMQAGAQVRHLLAPDDWPCVVFSEGDRPPPRPDGRPWMHTSYPWLFLAPGRLERAARP